jgi:hypothetical protein
MDNEEKIKEIKEELQEINKKHTKYTTPSIKNNIMKMIL